MAIQIVIEYYGEDRIDDAWQPETFAYRDQMIARQRPKLFTHYRDFDWMIRALKSAELRTITTETYFTSGTNTFQHNDLIGANIVGVPVLDKTLLQFFSFDPETGTILNNQGVFPVADDAIGRLTIAYQPAFLLNLLLTLPLSLPSQV